MAIRVLVVDDSALMRRALKRAFESAGDFVIETAHDGADALRAAAEFAPDVITLDINMPKMDGLTALSQLMLERPTPVVMVSSLTQRDALPTLEALALGAVDFVAKPDGTVSRNIHVVEAELVAKVRAAAGSRRRAAAPSRAKARERSAATRPQRARTLDRTSSTTQRVASRTPVTPRTVAARPLQRPVTATGDLPLVMLGVSTGGPRTLEDILPHLPPDFPYPVLVVIHMPAPFTGPFAARMNSISELEVVEVSSQMTLEPGRVYLARGDADMIVAKRLGRLVAMITPADTSLPWHPSVERMVDSAMKHAPPSDMLAVMLTGMGDDGAKAMKRLFDEGGHTLAESEETAVVYGMPRVLIEMGGASEVLPADAIAQAICAWAEAKEG